MLIRLWGIRRYILPCERNPDAPKDFCLAVFVVVVPGVLSAQERKLKGKVVSVGEQGEESPEVGLMVTLDESGNTDNTNSHGVWGLPARPLQSWRKSHSQHR